MDERQVAASYIETACGYQTARQARDAERIMEEATHRFPNDPEVFIKRAKLAQDRADWREALRRWHIVRQRFPDLSSGYDYAGHALRHLLRCDEADEIVEAGLKRLPGNLELQISHAWTATVRKDWGNAELRWRAVLEQHPLSAHGFVGLAEVLRSQDRNNEAEAALRAGLVLLPGNAMVGEAFAMTATHDKNWVVAAERWAAIRNRFPERGIGHHQLGLALRRLDLVDEAERVLEEGTRLVPDYLPLAIEHAWCANVRENWLEALCRWQTLDTRFPADSAVQEGLLNTRLNAAEDAARTERRDDMAVGCDPMIEPRMVDPEFPDQLLAKFESLGENCEFGLVQRHYGIEPISLFRWGSITMGDLADAMEGGLHDVGNEQQTSITVTAGHEYYVTDSRYKFGMHTFVQQETIEQDIFLDKQCRRLRFLRRRFLEELGANEKIFVYFQRGDVDQTQVSRLHDALRTHGEVTLLQVRLHDEAHPAGSVEQACQGLLIGYIERFGKQPWDGWDINYESWLTICRTAYRMRWSQTPQPTSELAQYAD